MYLKRRDRVLVYGPSNAQFALLGLNIDQTRAEQLERVIKQRFRAEITSVWVSPDVPGQFSVMISEDKSRTPSSHLLERVARFTQYDIGWNPNNTQVITRP